MVEEALLLTRASEAADAPSAMRASEALTAMDALPLKSLAAMLRANSRYPDESSEAHASRVQYAVDKLVDCLRPVANATMKKTDFSPAQWPKVHRCMGAWGHGCICA